MSVFRIQTAHHCASAPPLSHLSNTLTVSRFCPAREDVLREEARRRGDRRGSRQGRQSVMVTKFETLLCWVEQLLLQPTGEMSVATTK